jgi:hypothetical protein
VLVQLLAEEVEEGRCRIWEAEVEVVEARHRREAVLVWH